MKIVTVNNSQKPLEASLNTRVSKVVYPVKHQTDKSIRYKEKKKINIRISSKAIFYGH